MGDRPNPVSHWTNLRDGFAAVRELMIVLLILAFLLVPQRVGKFLQDAGIRSVAGVEFDWQKFKDAQKQIDLAKTDMQDVQVQLSTVSSLLSRMQPAINNSNPSVTGSIGQPEASRSELNTGDIDQLLKTVESARSKSQDIDQRLQQAKQYSEDVMNQPVLTPPDQLFGKQ